MLRKQHHTSLTSLCTMTMSEAAAPEPTTAPTSAPESSGTEMLSPNAMARAVLDQAVLERGSQQQQQSTAASGETLGVQDSNNNNNKRPRDNSEQS